MQLSSRAIQIGSTEVHWDFSCAQVNRSPFTGNFFSFFHFHVFSIYILYVSARGEIEGQRKEEERRGMKRKEEEWRGKKRGPNVRPGGGLADKRGTNLVTWQRFALINRVRICEDESHTSFTPLLDQWLRNDHCCITLSYIKYYLLISENKLDYHKA